MKFTLTICLIFFTVFLVDAQTRKISLKTVERSGWVTPVFADEIKKTEEGYEMLVEDIDIQTKEHKLAKEQILFVESCNAQADEEAFSKNKRNLFSVRSFRTLEVKGRVFAYFVYYVGVVMSKDSFGYLGCARPSYYVDEKGDGKFTLRCDGMQLKNIPQWVKDLAENKSSIQ
jgi:hypothetical protein